MSEHVKNLNLVPRSRRGWKKTFVHAIIVAAVLATVSAVVYLIVTKYNEKKTKDMRLGRAEMRRQYADFIPKEALLQDMMREANRNTETTFFSNQNPSTVKQDVQNYSNKIEEIENERAAELKRKHIEEQKRIREVAARMKHNVSSEDVNEPSPIFAPKVSEEKQKDLIEGVANESQSNDDVEMRKILENELSSVLNNAKEESDGLPSDLQSYATAVLHNFNMGLQEQIKKQSALDQQ